MGRCLNWTSEEDLTTTLKSNRMEAKTKQKTLIGLEPDGVNTEVREVKGTLMSTRAVSAVSGGEGAFFGCQHRLGGWLL